MPLVCPYTPFIEIDIFVRSNPSEEHNLWSSFIATNMNLVRTVECGELVRLWGLEISRSRLSLIPSLSEQQTLLFNQLPNFERCWEQYRSNDFATYIF